MQTHNGGNYEWTSTKTMKATDKSEALSINDNMNSAGRKLKKVIALVTLSNYR